MAPQVPVTPPVPSPQVQAYMRQGLPYEAAAILAAGDDHLAKSQAETARLGAESDARVEAYRAEQERKAASNRPPDFGG